MNRSLVILAAAVALCVAQAFGQGAAPLRPRAEMNQAGPDWNVSTWAGLGYWSGDVTYQIGGSYRDSDGNRSETWFPISELKWPISVAALSAGANGTFDRTWELRGKATVNLSSDAGTMEDSDWEDETDTSLKTTYSESDTRFSGWSADLGVRYWFLRNAPGSAPWGLGGGLGYLCQRLQWDGSDLDQWYPQNPEAPHDVVAGKVVTYEVAADIPYLEVAGLLQLRALSLDASLGVSPYAMISDKDDHLLRYIVARTDATGPAVKFDLTGRYWFTGRLFARAGVGILWFYVQGTEKDSVYGGEDAGSSWEIDHEIMSTQTSIDVGAGYRF